MSATSTPSLLVELRGSLSNHNDGENENVKKQLVFMNKPTAPLLHHAFSRFLVRFFEVYCTTNDVKPPNATIYEGREHTTTNFPFSFRTSIKSIRIQLGERSPTFDKLPYY